MIPGGWRTTRTLSNKHEVVAILDEQMAADGTFSFLWSLFFSLCTGTVQSRHFSGTVRSRYARVGTLWVKVLWGDINKPRWEVASLFEPEFFQAPDGAIHLYRFMFLFLYIDVSNVIPMFLFVGNTSPAC